MSLAFLVPLAVTGAVLYGVLAFKMGFMLADFVEERTDQTWLRTMADLVWMAWAFGVPFGLLMELIR